MHNLNGSDRSSWLTFLSGDTGTLHLALMSSVPTVSWFRPNPGSQPWLPVGECHRTLFGADTGLHGSLRGIEAPELAAATQSVLEANAASPTPAS